MTTAAVDVLLATLRRLPSCLVHCREPKTILQARAAARTWHWRSLICAEFVPLERVPSFFNTNSVATFIRKDQPSRLP